MSLTILNNALTVLRERWRRGHRRERGALPMVCRAQRSLVTALNPRIGYARAAEIAKRAMARGKTIREIIEEEGLLTPTSWRK